MLESEFVFRPYRPEERAFIESSWAQSYFSACRIKDLLSPEEFHKFHRPLRDRFFCRPTATVIVACGAEDPDVVIGWAAVEILPNCTCLHYVYVKATFRREWGVARGLLSRALPPGPVIYSHLTSKAMKILSLHQDYFKDFRYVPHIS